MVLSRTMQWETSISGALGTKNTPVVIETNQPNKQMNKTKTEGKKKEFSKQTDCSMANNTETENEGGVASDQAGSEDAEVPPSQC